ncbi:ataxin-3 isoform X2 [Brachionus plicatilis]|uniref:ubiquitinyl hydrolase 1 n=1 Tax=Brachionus plicatilis TaxID=10195 RepID=A0A3M7RIS2_BRAPC|nr:ataxin-3 isoform X2 [Brachionus plicatilis]
MELIHHEAQEGLLCAQHCLNSLLQGDYYSAIDLANIAHEIDRIERGYMTDYSANESSNYDDSGFFSIQVIQEALKMWSLELVPFKSSNQLACLARQDPTELKAYICNYKQHWYTIRKIGKYWFNLNSMFKKPELISDTYLTVLLKQLEHEGYSIFIVDGDLPNCQADQILNEINLDTKEILRKQNTDKEEIKKGSQLNENTGFDDDELKQAIKMSLQETDYDPHEKLYPSLANEEDSELKRAIELSLQANSNQKVLDECSPSTSDKLDQAEEIRRRRLDFLNKQ